MATNSLGYEFFGDSVYPLRFEFAHSGRELTLVFTSSLLEGKGVADESWGLDNVTVRTVSPRPNDGAPRVPGPIPVPR